MEIKRPTKVIGSATVEAMQSGLYHGYIGLVDGILQKMIDELGGAPRVIATGGLAPLIAKGSEFIETVDETLTLEGLRLVYERAGSKSSVGAKSLWRVIASQFPSSVGAAGAMSLLRSFKLIRSWVL